MQLLWYMIVHLLPRIQRAPHTTHLYLSRGFVMSSYLIATLDPESGRLFALA